MHTRSRSLLGIFGGLSLASLGLFIFGAIDNRSMDHVYLFWNLFLAWIPLLLALLLARMLRTRRWSSWPAIGVSLAWLGFLPNTFYMVTDYIHVNEAPRADVVYDTVMFTLPILTAFLLGIVSMYIVHRLLQERISGVRAWRVIALVALLASFAIYIGRFLRWNTWDMITNPSGILFDLSDIILQPLRHGQVLVTTMSFFVLIMISYWAFWRGLRLIKG